jgi:hypothetical protein
MAAEDGLATPACSSSLTWSLHVAGSPSSSTSRSGYPQPTTATHLQEDPPETCTGRAPHARPDGHTLNVVENSKDVREFLASRRAKVTPDQVGLPAGMNRRVPGLRRSEVAALAEMSVEYYSKLERGAIAGASASVLERSHVHCNSTPRSVRICSTWHKPPRERARSRVRSAGPRSSG